MGSDPLRTVRPRRAAVPNQGGRPPARLVGVSDPLAAWAAELHAQALQADALAARYRAERDELIDRLRAAEPKRWSYTALAQALGCSRELIAQIVRRRR